MRLDKFLSDAQNISRSDSKKLIKEKKVTVNDLIVTNINTAINEEKDIVRVDNKQIIYKKYIYLMLNKPKDYICANYDNVHKTVIDLIPVIITLKLVIGFIIMIILMFGLYFSYGRKLQKKWGKK